MIDFKFGDYEIRQVATKTRIHPVLKQKPLSFFREVHDPATVDIYLEVVPEPVMMLVNKKESGPQ